MKFIKKGITYISVFFCTIAILMGLLVCAAMIPKSAIKENVQKSAEFLCEGKLFGTVVEGVNGSKIDRYADSILLAIAYQYDEKEPLTSVMWSSYYYTKYQNENKNLFDAVTQDLPANQQYLRYWHGSNVIVRPLLLVFSLEQIYVINGIVIVILIAVLLGLLIKEKAWAPALGFAAGLVLTNSWYVPLSLEYTWSYILMLAAAIVCWKVVIRQKYAVLDIVFLAIGILTNFMDFLTTETMTVLVPLLLVVWVELNRNKCGSVFGLVKNAVKWMVLWGVGYVGMWLMKWGLASVVLQQNVMPYVTGHIAERVSGDVGLGLGQYIVATIGRNIGCLFPFEYGLFGRIAGLVFWFVFTYVICFYHKEQIIKGRIFCYIFISMIPFVRYLVLMNHSYLHAFFTYRALFATVFSLMLILDEVVEWRWLIREYPRKRKS